MGRTVPSSCTSTCSRDGEQTGNASVAGWGRLRLQHRVRDFHASWRQYEPWDRRETGGEREERGGGKREEREGESAGCAKMEGANIV